MKITYFEGENPTSSKTYNLNNNVSHRYGSTNVNLSHYKLIFIMQKPAC